MCGEYFCGKRARGIWDVVRERQMEFQWCLMVGGKIARLLLLRGRAEDAGLNGRDMGGLENCLTVKMQSNGMVCGEEGKLVRVMVKSLY
jgi:hypothetical protein